jgi:hypothetical protein
MSFMGDEKACGEVEVEEVTEWYDCSGEEEVEELTDWYDVTVPFSITDRSAVFSVTFLGIPGNPALSFTVPEGCVAGSIFRVHLSADAVKMVLDYNRKHLIPVATDLGIDIILPDWEEEEEIGASCLPVPNSITASAEEGSPSQMTQLTLNQCFMRESMERFRAHVALGIYESPEEEVAALRLEEATAPPPELAFPELLGHTQESQEEELEMTELDKQDEPLLSKAASGGLCFTKHNSCRAAPAIETVSEDRSKKRRVSAAGKKPAAKKKSSRQQKPAGKSRVRKSNVEQTSKVPHPEEQPVDLPRPSHSPQPEVILPIQQDAEGVDKDNDVDVPPHTEPRPSHSPQPEIIMPIQQDAEQVDRDSDDDVCCFTCGKTPCEWLEFGVPVLAEVRKRWDCTTATTHGYVICNTSTRAEVKNNKIRFAFYRMFTYEKFGCLGANNRIKIPDCVEEKIKSQFPDPDGSYTNFAP